MVPDKFDMVNMEGIDLIESQGVAVEGLYQKLVDSIAQCRYQCLYNWKFDGIIIPPSYVEMENREDGVWINEGVMVNEEDVIHIYSIEPEPPAPIEPEIQPLTVTENGEYYAPVGVDGYNPVIVATQQSEYSENVINFFNMFVPQYAGGYEYKGYLYGTTVATNLNLVMLADCSQGADSATLSAPIDGFSGVFLQGIYNKQRTSQYNTSILYLNPVLNTRYWAGMKDRNDSYTCYVTFDDNKNVTLAGNKQVIIYGIF